MKKFLIITILLILLVLGLNYIIYYRGFYIDLARDAKVEVQFTTKGKKIYLMNNDGTYKPLVIKGVDLSNSIPGHKANEYAIDSKKWFNWFSQIQRMGANTIRTYSIYNDTFYNAFYEYNNGRKNPLYLIQGIDVADPDNSAHDDYSKSFYGDATIAGELTNTFTSAVDVIHGRKTISNDNMQGGYYRKDVSKWVLGYIVGNEWNPKTIAYTNHNKGHLASFAGKFFKTADTATFFEVMLARVMDKLVSYESKKYKTQRLISFINDPQNDPFVYDDFYAKQLYKYNNIDFENILPTDNLRSGYFAAYRLYKFCPDFLNYFSANQKQKLSNVLKNSCPELYYDGYTQILARYHTMPVIIAGYSFSSARGTDYSEGTLTEEEQGKKLLSVYNDIIDSGCKGAFISKWQDEWEKVTWNTSYTSDITKTSLWHDIQSKEQGCGLLSFDSGTKKSAVYVDGNSSEWREKDKVFATTNKSLAVRYDESALYLLIKKKGLKEGTPIYVPIDITPKSGSEFCIEPRLSFKRGTDFLISINGRDKSRILVQERYNSLRANYLMQTEGDNPYIEPPAKDSAKFVPMRMILKNNKLINQAMSSEEIRDIHLFETFETGKLTYGNTNPYSKEYHSCADFCYGFEFLEIRLPWQLLNFYDPSDMQIHDDYYQKYGVEGIPIEKIYLGICEPDQANQAAMAVFNLQGWGKNVQYHERLKRSYYILKESWGTMNDLGY